MIDASACGETSSEVSVRIDAVALAQPGSWLRVCVDGLCNEDESPDASVSVLFPAIHPTTAAYSVTRVAGSGVSVGIARGVLSLPCGSEGLAVLVTVDADGRVTIVERG